MDSSTAAEAPGYTADTWTTGGAISGYCEMGSTRMEAMPASAMKSEMTIAKIGRSMKKRENMDVSYFFSEGFLSEGPGASDAFASPLPGAPLPDAPGAPGGGAFGSPNCTCAPG